MTEIPTLAGLASELADALARIARLESMTAHPEWCVPLEAEEEGQDVAGGWSRWEFRGWAFGRHVGAGRAWSSMAAPLRLATDADRERVDLPRDHWPGRPPKPNTDFLLGSIPPRTPGECDDCGSRTLGPDEIAVKMPERADASDSLLAIADALEAQESQARKESR